MSENNEGNLTRNIGEMFERFARDFFSPELDSTDIGYRPSIEVQETQTGYIVSAELPGMKEEDIGLTLLDNSLVIEGLRENQRKDDGATFYRTEFSYGNFKRTIPLQDDVDNHNIKATFADGILRVEFIRSNDGTEKTFKIPINKH